MKRVFLSLLFCSAALIQPVFAQESATPKTAAVIAAKNAVAHFQIGEITQRLSESMLKEVSTIPEKPHFVLGLEPKTDEWEQFLEQRKVFQTKDLFYGANGLGIVDKSRDDYIARGNAEIIEHMEVAGKSLRIVYTHHHLTKDGMYVYRSQMGEKNLAEFAAPLYRRYEVRWGIGNISDNEWADVQRVLGWAQFEAVRLFVHDAIRTAVEKNVKDYTEMRLTERVLELRSKLLDDPEYKNRLDDRVPGSAQLKVRDIIPVPMTRQEDFLPDLLVVGPRGFYGGFANLKTPGTERIVFLDLLGLALRYVSGWPLVEHEFVHTNPYLQSTPLDHYYDVEMFAAITTDLENGMREYLHHNYLAVLRDLVETYMGYNHKEVIRRINPESIGVRDIREDEFRKHVKITKRIREELLRFIKDPENGFMVRFYADPYFWVTVNTQYCDTAAALRLMFALRYDPAGIFDPSKKGQDGKVIPPAEQTKIWLSEQEESGQIKRLAEAAMKKTGELTEFGRELSKTEELGELKCPVHSRFFMLDKQEQQQFIEQLKPVIEQAKFGNVEARILLMRMFGGSGTIPYLPIK